jgi:hypothetical protein
MTHVTERLRAVGGGVPAQAEQKRSDCFRADEACLEARGYTVR